MIYHLFVTIRTLFKSRSRTPNLSNQGVRMKIKESEISKIKIHAHVYINLFFCEKLRLVSFKKSFHIQLYLLLCCVPRVTRLKCSSLYLNTFNQFQNLFQTRFNDQKRQRSDDLSPVFRNVAIHKIAVSKTLLSSNQNVILLNVG